MASWYLAKTSQTLQYQMKKTTCQQLFEQLFDDSLWAGTDPSWSFKTRDISGVFTARRPPLATM